MRAMRRQTLFVLALLILSTFFSPASVAAEVGQLPQLGGTDLPPEIDGKFNDTEWQNSVEFNTTEIGENSYIKVTSNTTHVFIGFNYSSSSIFPVNNTVPAYNHTMYNYTLGYNNQTHNWFAFVFDNNLDKVFDPATNIIGTQASPDDVVVVDQYNGSYYDGYADGNTTQLFSPDRSILYNGTVDPADTAGINGTTVPLGINGTLLQGNEGTFDVTLASTNKTTDADEFVTTYELVKPITGTDANGFDLDLQVSRMLQFKILYFNNAEANATMTEGLASLDQSPWYSLRINETGNGIASQTAEESSVSVIVSDEHRDQFDGLTSILSSYGFDVSFDTNLVNTSLEAFDINIIIVDEDTELTSDDFDDIIDYLRTGGQVMLMFSGETSQSSSLASRLKLNFRPNSLLLPDENNENNSLSSIAVDTVTTDLPLSSQATPYTSYEVNRVNFTSSGFNITNLVDGSESYVLSQEYMVYDLLETPTEAVYDVNDNAIIDDDETSTSLSMGVALDLLKGGRITALPTDTIFSDRELVQDDNIAFLLRLMTWNMRVINTMQVQDVSVDTNAIELNGEISISVNVTDGFGDQLPVDATVDIELVIGGNTFKKVTLEKTTGSSYAATFSIDKQGFYNLEITASLKAFGFAEGRTLNIFVQNKVGSFNDLADLSPILIILFLISVAGVGLIYMRTRDT